MYEPGTIITLRAGAYRLCAPLAGSAYGLLWRAQGPGHVGDVALKLVNRARMDGAGRGQRDCWIRSAHAEIAFLASLRPWDQRHIVRMLDSGSHDDLPAFALELMQCDLAQHLARAAPLPFSCILDWIAQVNHALATVHQHGWRYLDLKPANLLLDAAGNLKLTDFGTSQRASVAAHAYSGTPRWQAPEQFFPDAQGRYDTDCRTDYFALGALFHYLVTGGEALSFCSACAEAFRLHGSAHGPRSLCSAVGKLPPTLTRDEAARFAEAVDDDTPGAAQAALALLRRLLAPQREQRPRHALDISRAVQDVRARSPRRWRRAA
ncbi:protein kinase [Massilia solisilvae]|uniref:Protein kinase n=1 Tax=Massilia solisilvae TaxID=1811225 RepID=A0ABT2BMJ4_9BURK|nr:protein kinase [Massilia solisilvae]MCS0609616.1 protein kinase [Massilia solisilvae]